MRGCAQPPVTFSHRHEIAVSEIAGEAAVSIRRRRSDIKADRDQSKYISLRERHDVFVHVQFQGVKPLGPLRGIHKRFVKPNHRQRRHARIYGAPNGVLLHKRFAVLSPETPNQPLIGDKRPILAAQQLLAKLDHLMAMGRRLGRAIQFTIAEVRGEEGSEIGIDSRQ